MLTNKNRNNNINLNDKIIAFINWYFENMFKSHYTDLEPTKMRNFIEKMAVWYELRYPDYEINRLIPSLIQEENDIDNVMFNENKYINENFNEDSDVRILTWDKFYNIKAFINGLPEEEKSLFQKPQYRDLVYVDPKNRMVHLHLSSNGIVQKSEGLGSYTNYKVNDNDLEKLHLEDVVQILKEKGIVLPSNNELEETIDYVQKKTYQKEEMLNCVMYRIIKRGGNRIGPRRALLFAKEFRRNIDIPMMYGVDDRDPGLRIFINEYLKAGGSTNLKCYNEYFLKEDKREINDRISIQELLKSFNNYTDEETKLHQKFINIIKNQIDLEELKKEEDKQLRIQRKLKNRKK